MTLEDLRAFVAAYRVGSLSEAARQLHCTQGAVAQHVRKLERELRAELFSRVPRGVAPTHVGNVLYEGASSALGHLEMAVREIDRATKRRAGTLSLAASAMAATGFLRPSILALQRRHPKAEIHIEPENTAEARLAALREGRADLAFVPLTDPLPGLEVRRAFEVELLLLVHFEHKFAERKRLRAAELHSLQYISQDPASATYRHIDRALRAAGVVIEPSEIVEEPTAAIFMVELGRGQTFIPAGQVPTVERSGLAKAVRVPSLPPLEMGWAARNFALLPEPAVDFLALFAQFARKL